MFSSPYRVDHHGGGYQEYNPMTFEEWAQHAFETLRALRGIVIAEREEASFMMKPVFGGMEEAIRNLLDEYTDYLMGEKERDRKMLFDDKKKKEPKTEKSFD